MLKRALMLGAALGITAILSVGVTNAQDQGQESVKKIERSGTDDCANNEDCAPTAHRKRGADPEEKVEQRKDRKQARDLNDDDGDRKVAQSNWRYNPQKHRRSRDRDATFRFYFGGFYYPEPYWDAPVVVYSNRGRVSCERGRRIVDRSGFNRVRVIECAGRNYTYKARRHGDVFRVVLNSRNGRIISVRKL